MRWSGRAATPPAPSADAVTLSPDALVDAAANPSDHRRAAQGASDAAGARGGIGGGAERGHRAGQPGAAVCQSRRGGLDRQSAAEIAAGDCAGAGATDEPRSKPRRRRHQDGFPEVRHFPRGVAGIGLGAVRRRSRSQGRADRAAPDAAIGARHEWQRTAPATAAAHASSCNTQRGARPCSVPANLDVQEILLPQARLATRRRYRSIPGNAGRSALAAALDAGPTAGSSPEPAAGSAAGTRQSGAALRSTPKDVRSDDVTVHTNTPPPPFRGALPSASRSRRPRSRRMRRSRHRASSARRHRCRDCAADPAAGGVAAGSHRRFSDRKSIRPRRAGISKFRL